MEDVYTPAEHTFRQIEGRATSYFKLSGRPDLIDHVGAEILMQELEQSFPRAHVSLQYLFVRDPFRIENTEQWPQHKSAHPLSLECHIHLDQARAHMNPIFECCYLAISTPTEMNAHDSVLNRMMDVLGSMIVIPCTWMEFDEEFTRPGTEADPLQAKSDRAMNFPTLVEAIGPSIPWRMRFTIDLNHPAAVKLVRAERRKDWFLRLIGARARMAPAYQTLDEDYFTWVVCDLKIDTWGDTPAQEQVNHMMLSCVLTDGSFKRLLDYPVMELGEAISLMPVYRPGSPWKAGDLHFITRDGKQFPYRQDSNRRHVLTDLIFSKDPSDTEAFRLSSDIGLIAAAQNLPRIVRIQIGADTDPLLNLISKEFSASEQGLASQFAAVANDAFCVNIFDTALGYQNPVNGGFEAATFLEALLCHPANQRDTERFQRMVHDLIRATYKHFSQDGFPKPYVAGVDRVVDDELSRITLEVPATWWAATDILHAHQSNRVAVLAQRHAVPVLADLALILRGEMMIRTQRGVGEGYGPNDLSSDALANEIESIIESWPSLSAPTRFDLGSSRFTTINVVAEDGEPSKRVANLTAVLYLLARKAVCGDYFSDPDRYRLGYSQEASSYDRLHREVRDNVFSNGISRKVTYSNLEGVMDSRAVNDQILSDVREARKLWVMISLESSEAYNNQFYRSTGGVITLSPEKISKEDRSKLPMEQIGSYAPLYSRMDGGINVLITSSLKSHRYTLRQNLVLPTKGIGSSVSHCD
jgi:hypothetical protein